MINKIAYELGVQIARGFVPLFSVYIAIKLQAQGNNVDPHSAKSRKSRSNRDEVNPGSAKGTKSMENEV